MSRIEPHEGAQSRFLSSDCDIVIYGGGRGGGKTYGLLLEAVRHIRLADYRAVIFRRTFPRIKMAGSLWDTSEKLYPMIGGVPNQSELSWTFPSGAKIQFAHLQHPKDLQNWYGAQVAMLGFDQLEEFTEKQFWTLQGSNRSTCGIKPYCRATCNPDSESWLRQFIGWWISDDGFPVAERSGVKRLVARLDDELVWGDSQDELKELAASVDPMSVTFIQALLKDNPTLLHTDPGYFAKLKAMDHVEQQRMLHGNWDVAPEAGMMFPRDKWQFTDVSPKGDGVQFCRFWDKAATEGGKGARTAGVLVAIANGVVHVVDAVSGRWGDAERERMIRTTAEMDRAMYGHVDTGVEQEPGSGGKDSAMATMRNLHGFSCFAERPSGAKSDRWRPFASQQQAGNVCIVRGSWRWQEYVRELDQLSGDAKLDSGRLKDLADATAGAYTRLAGAFRSTIDRPLLCSGGDDDPLANPDLGDVELTPFLRDLLGE